MKVLLVSVSNSKTSINDEILKRIQSKENFSVLKFSDYKTIPILSKDLLEINGIPEEIKNIYFEFLNYEKIVFFAPEHNAYLSAFFKNILDWLSLLKKDFLESKKVLLVSVSTTAKELRNMENSVRKTFDLFSPLEFNFFNFNNYSESNTSENMIAKLIESIKK